MILLCICLFTTAAYPFPQYPDSNQLDNSYLVSSVNLGISSSTGTGDFYNSDVPGSPFGGDSNNPPQPDAAVAFSPTNPENAADSVASSSSQIAYLDPSISPVAPVSDGSSGPDVSRSRASVANDQIGMNIPPKSSVVPVNSDPKRPQQQAFGDDGGILPFPLNLVPMLGGDAPGIPSIPNLFPDSPIKPQRPPEYHPEQDDEKRLTNPNRPNCDDGSFPMCCNKGPPTDPNDPKYKHRRRECRTCMSQILFKPSFYKFS